MEYLVKDEELVLQYHSGKGSWTYHISIPNTEAIKGKWGDLKVSGFIDGYKIECRNIAPKKGQDKILSINETIRKAISKSGRDRVMVTLYMLPKKNQINKKQILDSFKDAEVLHKFEALNTTEQQEILQSITSQSTEEKQVNKIVWYINKLSR